MSTMPITQSPLQGPAAPAPATDLLAAAGGAVALGNVPASETGAGFLALVQQALHLVDGQADGTADAEGTSEEGESTDVIDQPVELASVLPFLTGIPVPVTPAAQANSGSDDAGASDPNLGNAATVTATAGTGAGAPKPETPASAGAVDGTGPHAATEERSGRLAPAEAGAAGPDATATAPAPTASTIENATAIPTSTTSVTSSAPTTSIAATPGTAAPAADPVTTQVVDQITSLVSRGNGTHRITMKLNPEQLGEVRVVMTMREGAVHVRLAASEPQAHQALLQGSPELTRLLEVAGAGDARISVREISRDLGQGSTDTSTAFGSSTPDQGTGEGRASNRSQDEYAGTRADHPATDGAHNPRRFAAGPTGHRSNESVTSSRATGLDVTI